jgi:hypothetical protein
MVSGVGSSQQHNVFSDQIMSRSRQPRLPGPDICQIAGGNYLTLQMALN